MCAYIYIYMHIYNIYTSHVYVYIYIYRERERIFLSLSICIYTYIYIYIYTCICPSLYPISLLRLTLPRFVDSPFRVYFPMGMRVPPLRFQTLPESTPLKSRSLSTEIGHSSPACLSLRAGLMQVPAAERRKYLRVCMGAQPGVR